MPTTVCAATAGSYSGGWTRWTTNLPAAYQHVAIQGDGESVYHLANAAGLMNPGFNFDLSAVPAYVNVSSAYLYGYKQGSTLGTWGIKDGAGNVMATLGDGDGFFYAYPVSITRANLAAMEARPYTDGDGSGNPARIDYLVLYITWSYITVGATTLDASLITTNTARLNGSVAQNGDAGAERYFEWGTTSGSYTSNSGWAAANGATYHDLTGLTPGVRYFFRMRARNSHADEVLGAELNFTAAAGTPTQNKAIRETLSKRLWRLRKPVGLLECVAPLRMLDVKIGSLVAVQAQYGPAPTGSGWGTDVHTQRLFRVLRKQSTPGDRGVRLTLLDMRHLGILHWDTGRTDLANLSAYDVDRDNGVARILRGASRAYTRATKAWIANPSDPSSVIELPLGQPAINQDGELFEAASSNYFPRSSGVSGTTGLTLTGTGTNGSQIAGDLSAPFFNPAASPGPIKLTAGNPHTADLGFAVASASFAGSSVVTFSCDHWEDAGADLRLRIQRSSDGFYLTISNGTWGASVVNNALPAVTARAPGSRYQTTFSLGASAATLTASFWLLSGGTASRVARVGHFQGEVGRYATSRILTDASSGVVRNKTELTLTFGLARANYAPALGSWYCEVVANWSSADLTSTDDRFVFYMTTNGGADYDALYYDASAGAWTFERKVGASTYVATKTAAVVRGTVYRVACRWTGSAGELGLAAYALSVLVDGVAGSPVASAAPTFGATETLSIGHDGSKARQFDGVIRDRRVYPVAFADVELARLP